MRGAYSRLAIALLLASSPALGDGYSDDAVKAAFLYRFTSYVEWPPQALQSQSFTIAVLDDERVAVDLQKLLPGHPIKGHPAQVRVIHRATEIGDAPVVFIGSGDPYAHRRFIAGIASRPILVVTDEERGLEEGSSVNFMLVDRRVRFEISLNAAERSGLRISSELLSVAAHVEGHLRSDATCVSPAGSQTGTACQDRVAFE